MSKVVGFLFESASAIPVTKVLRSAMKHPVFMINSNDDRLREAHSRILSTLQTDEWRATKYDILDNLWYFLDERRQQQCDLTVKIDDSSNIQIHKDHDELRKELM